MGRKDKSRANAFEGIWPIRESDGKLLPPDSKRAIRRKGNRFSLEISLERKPGNAIEIRTGEKVSFLSLALDGGDYPLFDPRMEAIEKGLRVVYGLPDYARVLKGKLEYRGLKDLGFLFEIDISDTETSQKKPPELRLCGTLHKGDFSDEAGAVGRPERGGWGLEKEDDRGDPD